jgi:hypothetical protein
MPAALHLSPSVWLPDAASERAPEHLNGQRLRVIYKCLGPAALPEKLIGLKSSS